MFVPFGNPVRSSYFNFPNKEMRLAKVPQSRSDRHPASSTLPALLPASLLSSLVCRTDHSSGLQGGWEKEKGGSSQLENSHSVQEGLEGILVRRLLRMQRRREGRAGVFGMAALLKSAATLSSL